MRKLIALCAVGMLVAGCSDGDPTGMDTGQVAFSHGDGGWDDVVLHEGDGKAGNPSCTELGYDLDFTVDSDDIATGTNSYFDEAFTTTISSDGLYLTEWASTVPVSAVIVKGGPAANEYVYVPSTDGDEADPGLHSPEHGGGIPEISHINFCVNKELLVTKDASTAFDRTWTWDVEKELDVTQPETFEDGDELSVDYTVTLSAASTDDNYAVSGTITILNHELFVSSVQIDDVTDLITADGMADVAADVVCDEDLPHTLGSGDTLECTYSADVDDDSDRLNTATVTTTGDVAGSFGTADVDFSDATINEIDECVDVEDVLTINGDDEDGDDLGQVCASDLDGEGEFEITYTHTFGSDSDFDLQCDENDVDNVVTFTTNDSSTTGSAEAGFEIVVVCGEEEEEEQEETAWAANGDEPLENRYTERGNWATYVDYDGTEKTTTFFAGQTIDVGTVHFSEAAGGEVTITITLSGDWTFAEDEVVAVQDYDDTPSGNPAPGRFDHKVDDVAGETVAVITVPEAAFYGVHGVVVK